MKNPKYEHRQMAPWIFGLLLGTVIVAVALFLNIGAEGLVISLLIFSIIFAVLALLFNSLKVVVGEKEIHLAFGVGIVKRSIERSTIVSVEKVRNSWWNGFGIRYTGHGWMWNISGLDAVELTYQNGKKFRIGTDEPDALLKALQKQD